MSPVAAASENILFAEILLIRRISLHRILFTELPDRLLCFFSQLRKYAFLFSRDGRR